MCILLDASIAALLVQRPPCEDAAAVITWLKTRGGQLVYGGLNSEELFRIRAVRRWVGELDRAGRAMWVSPRHINKELRTVDKLLACKSDDAHVIALARASGVRLLYSHDNDLHYDFTNSKLLSRPKGKVYQNVRHKRLLSHKDCRGRAKKRASATPARTS